MPVRLTVYLGSGTLERRTFDSGAFIIGRSKDTALAIDDPRVSREHARLAGAGGEWRIEDLASKNGTRVGGRAVASAPIVGDGWLSIGGVPVRFETLGARAVEPVESISAEAAIDSLLDGCLDAFCEIAGCSRASLWSRRDDGDVDLVRRRGDGEQERIDIIHEVCAGGAPVIASNAELGAMLCLPVVNDGAVAGAIYADAATPARAYSDLDVELLQSLADQAAIALAALRRARPSNRADR